MLGLANPDALDAEQLFRFTLDMSHFFSQQGTAWKEVRLGTITEHELSESVQRSRPFLESQGGQAWWSDNAKIFSRDFRDYLESQLPAIKPADSASSSSTGTGTGT